LSDSSITPSRRQDVVTGKGGKGSSVVTKADYDVLKPISRRNYECATSAIGVAEVLGETGVVFDWNALHLAVVRVGVVQIGRGP
jgi:hypothetical protein